MHVRTAHAIKNLRGGWREDLERLPLDYLETILHADGRSGAGGGEAAPVVLYSASATDATSAMANELHLRTTAYGPRGSSIDAKTILLIQYRGRSQAVSGLASRHISRRRASICHLVFVHKHAVVE